MKLLYCPDCDDIRKLQAICRYRTYPREDPRGLSFCACGKSWGFYKSDMLNAVYGGRALPLGIDNHTLAHALSLQSTRAKEHPIAFGAFIIEDPCPTVTYEDGKK
ncbi:MAG: hypothetical protein V3V96_14320 [Acidiferrobacterales bacterium]